MTDQSMDLFLQLSAALISATTSARSSVVAIRAPHSFSLSGTLWRHDLVVASEQVFPKADAAEVVRADGAAIRARVAGCDPRDQCRRLATRVADRVRSSRASRFRRSGRWSWPLLQTP